MKRFLIIVSLLTACAEALPEGEVAAEEEEWNYERHVAQRTAEIDAAPVEKGGALFVGNSITYGGGDWSRWFPGVETSNHGIGGDQSSALLARMDQITRGAPERVFLMIGTNDLSGGASPEEAASGALAVAAELRQRLPEAELYVQSVLPREAAMVEPIRIVNARLDDAEADLGYVYLDLFPHFATDEGILRSELTDDDLHLTEAGYEIWADVMDSCVRRGCDSL